MNSTAPVPTFLTQLSENPNLKLSLPFLWTVDFYFHVGNGKVLHEINNTLNKIGNNWTATASIDDFMANGRMMVAQKINLPNETVITSELAKRNHGAAMSPYGVSKRSSFLGRSFSANFLETHVDIEHAFFRPWLIALSIDGMLNMDLRCDIRVVQYSNVGYPRKGYYFKGCFPTACEGYGIDYNDSDFKVKSVTFGFHDYEPLILDDTVRKQLDDEMEGYYI